MCGWRFGARLFALCTCGLIIGSPWISGTGGAQAQQIVSIGDDFASEAQAVQESVSNQPRPEYDPIGIRLGQLLGFSNAPLSRKTVASGTLAPLQAGSNPEKTEPTYEAVVLRFNGAQLLTIMILAPLLTHLHGITGAALSVVLAAIIRDVGMGLLLPSKLGLAAGVWSRRGTRRAMELAMAKLGA